MKKFICILIVISFVGVCLNTLAEETFTESNPNIFLNGEQMVFSATPVIYNGRTLVPMRDFFEKLGATVTWEDETRQITATTPLKTIIMQIDNNWTLSNDISILNDVSPVLYKNKTMVPLRFIGEQFNLNVEWNAKTNTISMTTRGNVVSGNIVQSEEIDSTALIMSYSGELINQIPNGVGVKKYYLTEDDYKNDIPMFIEEGCFLDGQRNGFVHSYTPDVYIENYSVDYAYEYASFYTNDIENGFGWIAVDDSIVYGTYKNGELVGKCQIEYQNSDVYLGEINENYVPHGCGIITTSKGEQIETTFVNGVKNGNFTMRYPNGNIASEGVFENDSYNGYGKDYYETGELLYEGGHWDGARTAQGTMYYKSGSIIYTGQWEYNKASGYGKMYFETGILQYEGEFLNGGPNGYGILYNEDGSIKHIGNFVYDQTTNIFSWYSTNQSANTYTPNDYYPNDYCPNDYYPTTSSVIESRIDGSFEGWDGDTIFILTNGQIWQQSTYGYYYHYAYRPEVIIYKDGARYKMLIKNTGKEIAVKRLK